LFTSLVTDERTDERTSGRTSRLHYASGYCRLAEA